LQTLKIQGLYCNKLKQGLFIYSTGYHLSLFSKLGNVDVLFNPQGNSALSIPANTFLDTFGFLLAVLLRTASGIVVQVGMRTLLMVAED